MPEHAKRKQSFSREERIRKRKEFLNVYQKGKRIDSKHFIVVLSENQSGITRLGITATKKLGNAVKRNRIKRLLREFFRLNKDIIPDSKDIVIIAKRNLPFLKYQDVQRELENLFKKEFVPD